MAINPNTNFTSAVLTSSQMNRFPRGIMAYGTRDTTAGITTTKADLSISVTFTAEANRYYKYTFYAYATNNSTAATLAFYLANPSNTDLYVLNMYAPGGAFYTYAHLTCIRTETAGSITRKIRANTTAGSGSMYADSVNVAYLMVEDIGPA